MPTLKAIIAYDGAHFQGWQKNSKDRTVQEVLEKTLSQILQEAIQVEGASRTDAGVHAKGQVICFSSRQCRDWKEVKHSANRMLKAEIVMLSIEEVEPTFHPTLDGHFKEYTYTLSCGPFQLPMMRYVAWHVPYLLQIDPMVAASRFFIGQHDFMAFANNRKQWSYNDTYRIIYRCDVIPMAENQIQIVICGDHFLYKMVRNIVGTLVTVGKGELEPEGVAKILESKDRKQAAVTAPAHGLTLNRIGYQQLV